MENSEKVLLDIRHCKLSLEESKAKILLEIDSKFNNIVKAVKARKAELLKLVEEEFNGEITTLDEREGMW